MTPRAAVDKRIYEARMRFRYHADARRDADWIEQIAADYFNTPTEMEARLRGDCDDFAVWTTVRGYELAAAPTAARWALVLGRVLQSGQRLGHAWLELMLGDERLWADPTWGELCQAPADLGYPHTRVPLRLFPFDGLVFDTPIDIREVDL